MVIAVRTLFFSSSVKSLLPQDPHADTPNETDSKKTVKWKSVLSLARRYRSVQLGVVVSRVYEDFLCAAMLVIVKVWLKLVRKTMSHPEVIPVSLREITETSQLASPILSRK